MSGAQIPFASVRSPGAMVASAAATVVVVAWLLRNEIGDLRGQPAGAARGAGAQ